MRESLVQSQPSSRHWLWKPLPCLFFEEHIQSLSITTVAENYLLTTTHPPSSCRRLSGAKAEGQVGSVFIPWRLLGDLVNGVGKVAHIARGDPCHRDATVLCHVD